MATTIELVMRGRDRASGPIQSVIGKLGGLAGAGTAALGVVVGLGAAALKLSGDFRENAIALSRVSDSTGVSVKDLSALQFAFKTVGLETDDLDSILTEINIKLSDASAGTGAAADAFAALGLSVEELSSIPVDEALVRIADGLSSIESRSQKVGIVDAVFGGDDGRRLLPLLERGADGIEALRDEAEELGVTLDDDAVESAQSAEENINKLSATFDSFTNQIGEDFTPIITELAEIALPLLTAGLGFVADIASVVFDGISLLIGKLQEFGDTVGNVVGNIQGADVSAFSASEQEQARQAFQQAGGATLFGNTVRFADGSEETFHSSDPNAEANFIHSFLTKGGVQGRRYGGPVSAGTLYQVNELGMEYFRPNVGGSVIPLGQGGGVGTLQGENFVDSLRAEPLEVVIAGYSGLAPQLEAQNAQQEERAITFEFSGASGGFEDFMVRTVQTLIDQGRIRVN